MKDEELERLFRLYHAPLVRYLTRRLGDRDWAEEVSQETFLRALRQDSLASERSWLFAVATNLVRDEARKTARQRVHLELLANEQRVLEAERFSRANHHDGAGRDEGESGESASRVAEKALARKAVDALVERDRMALLMREEGLDYQEIADALGLSFKSVGTTLARARRRLTESFEALQRDDAVNETQAEQRSKTKFEIGSDKIDTQGGGSHGAS